MVGGGAVAFPVPGRSRYLEFPVPTALAGMVRALWTITVPEELDTPVPQLILPDGHGDLIVGPGGTLAAVGPAGRADRMLLASGSRYLGARLRPGALTALTGIRADELLDRHLPLGHLALDAVPIAGASSAQMLAALQHHLIEAVDRVPDGAATAQAACRLIEQQVEALSIRALADQLGVRERTLRDVFAVQVGMSPKALHQVRRLQRTLALAAGDPGRPLAALAHSAGYSDQAHLTRQCRSLTGLTPRQLLPPPFPSRPEPPHPGMLTA